MVVVIIVKLLFWIVYLYIRKKRARQRRQEVISFLTIIRKRKAAVYGVKLLTKPISYFPWLFGTPRKQKTYDYLMILEGIEVY